LVTTFACSVHAEGGKGASVQGAYVRGLMSGGLMSYARP